ncbi:MAG TPA: 3-keto-5-aminohexanoate cleavage protein [Pyrinomonadaceae bacterium]|nr:3-keto-5-aminohexanoate cleavage protein [Pyrinomonadaceae bacterium]
MLIKAAINGGRTRDDHTAVPLSPAELAADVVECLKAGAGAIHLHVRSTSDGAEKESLDKEDIDRTLRAVLAVAPTERIGISTGAWILPHPARLDAAKNWAVLPGFASVNFGEEGAVELAKLLLSRGVAVEAGLCDADAAQIFLHSGLATSCLRVLLEPQEQELKSAFETVNAMEDVLRSGAADLSFLLHGTEATVWPMMDEAIARGYDVRIGLEDTVVLPDGRTAKDNVELVTEANRRVVIKSAGASPPS